MFKAVEKMKDFGIFPEPLMSDKQVAERYGIAPRTLADWRYRGRGPKFIRISHRCVRYRPSDVQAYIDSLIRENTGQI